MLIEINTDNYIEGNERMQAYFTGVLEEAFKRFEERIIRIEMQLGDENAGKEGNNDKRCMLEARINGLKNVAVVNHADDLDKAVKGAIDKLKHALEHTFGKLQSNHR